MEPGGSGSGYFQEHITRKTRTGAQSAGELAQAQVVFHLRNLHGVECKPGCWRRKELALEEAGGERGRLGTEGGRRERQWDVEMLWGKHEANSFEL